MVTNSQPQIAIITDDPGWHGSELLSALRHHGLGGCYLSLTECSLTFDETDHLVRLPGFENRLPLGVFVRGVPGGTLEQVIFRLDILHALVNLGVTVYNDPRAIERTVDKALTTFHLKRAGLPTPATWVLESAGEAEAICRREFCRGRQLVLTPLFGSQGLGVHRITPETGLIHDEDFAELYYLQAYVGSEDSDWQDIRVFVIDGKARAAMRRHGNNWITNRAQGARCEAMPLDAGIVQLAEDAVRAIDIDYAGVDLIPDREGNLTIIEVNSIPAWWGLQSVTDIPIAESLIDHFIRRIGAGQSLTVST